MSFEFPSGDSVMPSPQRTNTQRAITCLVAWSVPCKTYLKKKERGKREKKGKGKKESTPRTDNAIQCNPTLQQETWRFLRNQVKSGTRRLQRLRRPVRCDC